MKRNFLFLIICILVLTVTGCSSQTPTADVTIENLIEKSKSITEYYCEAEVTNNPIKILNRTWVKDSMARIENLTLEGDKQLATSGFILDERIGIVSQYSIRHSDTSNANMTYATKEGESRGIRDYTFLREMDDLDLTKTKIIKHEKIDNYNCVVVDNGLTDYKKILWISIDLGVPIKAEINGQTINYQVKVGPGSVDDQDLLEPQN